MMEWARLLNDARLGRARNSKECLDYSTGRSGFVSDIDRVTFSPSFRRLARKTQVFPLAINDHVHNRLTHSLEVSRVGRTLGTHVGKHLLAERARYGTKGLKWSEYDFGAAVEAASLAHDIGHPPFGHAGDRAFHRWFEVSRLAIDLKGRVSEYEFADLTNFDGNAQGLRRIAQLDKNVFRGGLNLTFTTLAAYIKYPTWTRKSGSKNGFFRTERGVVDDVARGVGLLPTRNGYRRHPLSYLVESADDICYGFLDLEDAVEMNILRLQDVAEMLLGALPAKERDKLRPKEGDGGHRVVFARMRGKIFHEAIRSTAQAFLENYKPIMSGAYGGELLSAAADGGSAAARTVIAAKKRARTEIFQYENKANIELSSYVVVSNLLDAFVEAAMLGADQLKKGASSVRDGRAEMLLNMLGDHRPRIDNAPPGTHWTTYECVRRAIDYVSGMTDEFAIRLSHQLTGQIPAR